MGDPVLYEERDDIAIITLNRPEKKNALTDAVIQGIADGIDSATGSSDVVAVVLRPSRFQPERILLWACASIKKLWVTHVL